MARPRKQAQSKAQWKPEWHAPRLYETGKKVRRVVCLLYIEDMEKAGKNYYDLLAYLDHIHQPAIVSPVHDRDRFTGDDVLDWCTRHRDPETGDLDTAYIDSAPYVGKAKKPHCHLGLMSTGQYNAEEWSEIMQGFMDIRPSMWERMLDYDACVRYWCHMGSKDKAQYSAFDVQSIAGADLSALSHLDESIRIDTQKQVIDFIRERGITRWHTLVNLAYDSGDIDFINCISSRQQLFVSYFSSIQWQRRDASQRKRNELEVAKLQSEMRCFQPSQVGSNAAY